MAYVRSRRILRFNNAVFHIARLKDFACALCSDSQLSSACSALLRTLSNTFKLETLRAVKGCIEEHLRSKTSFAHEMLENVRVVLPSLEEFGQYSK